MATPSKNFSDPTTLSRIGPVLPHTDAPILKHAAIPFVWEVAPVDTTLPYTAPRLGPVMPKSSVPKIPIPPMGKQVILAFPVIYKEKPLPPPAVVRDPEVFWITPTVANPNFLPYTSTHMAENFDLFNFMPLVYREIDETDGSFQVFVWAFNQMWAELIYEAEAMPSNLVFSESTDFIADLANHHGNPFQFLTEAQLRRAVDNLSHIYARRGEEEGTKHVVWYLTGVQIDIIQDYEYSWKLGTSQLGFDTILCSRNAPMFRVILPWGLDDETIDNVKSIIQFMRPANLYYRFVIDSGE